MNLPTVNYGYWPSKISSQFLTSPNRQISYPQALGAFLYWQEKSDKGATICSFDGEDVVDLLAQNYEVGTQANVYGGQAWCPIDRGVIFVDKRSQQITCLRDGHFQVLPTDPEWRFADFHYHARTDKVCCVVEIPRQDRLPEAALAIIDLNALSLQVILKVDDFIAFPAWSQDGTHITFMRWSLEQMSWDNSHIETVSLAEGNHAEIETPPNRGSVFQPFWYRDDLWYASDHDSDGWRIYRNHKAVSVLPSNTEFGRPVWLFGWSTFAVTPSHLFALGAHEGRWRLHAVDLHSNQHNEISLPFDLIEDIISYKHGVVFIGESSNHSRTLCFWSEDTGLQRLRKDQDNFPGPNYISTPTQYAFETTDEKKAFSWFYAPRNPDVAAPNTRPPLMVLAHGGPTACSHGVFNPKIQYWTSRGFAVLDVNYRGSTGYGRAYRQSLNGHWGVIDSEDVINAVNHIIQLGLVDPDRVIARGSSAGAFTLLNAMRNNDVFKACACYYGVADLEALEAHTHKFEAFYNQSLIGPASHRAVYRQRSPLKNISEINTPTLFFHGRNDPVVSVEQSRAMHKALCDKDVPSQLIEYDDEGHGFKSAEVISDSLKRELEFYRDILKLHEFNA